MNLWGPAMFIGVLVMIFSGYPVAFSLAGTALIFAGLASIFGQFDLALLGALPQRTFGTMSNQVLLAQIGIISYAHPMRYFQKIFLKQKEYGRGTSLYQFIL